MRAFSSVASITVHVGVVAAVLLGTAQTARPNPPRPHEVPIIFRPLEHSDASTGGLGLPGPVAIPPVDVRFIPGPPTLPQTVASMPLFSPAFSGAMVSPGPGQPNGGPPTEEHAEVLTGPLPVYPDLLRQAGLEGRIVLEAVVDTTGRVLSQSIWVVSATNPGFVAAARRALVATLFRPARVGGTAVRMRVRIPYDFAIRNGTGRAR